MMFSSEVLGDCQAPKKPVPSLSFNVSEWSVIALRFISDKISDGFFLVPCRLWHVRGGKLVELDG